MLVNVKISFKLDTDRYDLSDPSKAEVDRLILQMVQGLVRFPDGFTLSLEPAFDYKFADKGKIRETKPVNDNEM